MSGSSAFRSTTDRYSTEMKKAGRSIELPAFFLAYMS
jgi:hypothetical protein